MKPIRKLLVVALLVVTGCAGSLWIESWLPPSAFVSAASAEETPVLMRAPALEWRYKFIDGKLYRRLYNCSTQEWVGDWELVE